MTRRDVLALSLGAACAFIGTAALLGLFHRVTPFEKRRNAYEEEGRAMQMETVDSAVVYGGRIARSLTALESQVVRERHPNRRYIDSRLPDRKQRVPGFAVASR